MRQVHPHRRTRSQMNFVAAGNVSLVQDRIGGIEWSLNDQFQVVALPGIDLGEFPDNLVIDLRKRQGGADENRI